MRRVFVLIFILFLLIAVSIPSAQNALAFSCVPKVTVDTGKDFNTVVNFGSIAPNVNDKDWLIINSQKISGELTPNRDLIFQIGKLPPGDYDFALQTNNVFVCKGTLRVPDVGQGGTAKIIEGDLEIIPPNPTSIDQIHITVKNLIKDSTYAIFLSKQNANLYAQDIYKLFCAQSANKQLDADIGTYTDGTWSVNVSEKDPNSGDICRISKNGIASGNFTISAPIIISPTSTVPRSPCAEFKDGKCIAVNTAIGEISTEPQNFVKSIFTIVLGLAGGIALILIILSGYKMMASQGNPEAITAARDQLISAIVGLLFIIFSFVILQVIGVDILRIPGFAK